MPAPRRALPTSVRAQKCGMVMSVTTQIIFPYMSDARAPAMDVQMAPQDAGMARSFWLILSAILNWFDRGYLLYIFGPGPPSLTLDPTPVYSN